MMEMWWVPSTVVVLWTPCAISRSVMVWWLVVRRRLVVLWLMVWRLMMRSMVRLSLRVR